MSVLLIYPPLASGGTPYLGLAMLSAHMRSRGIPVRILDVNLAFMNDLGGEERVRRGLEHVDARLQMLNSQPVLDFTECVEYLHMAAALEWEEEISRGIGPLFNRHSVLTGTGKWVDAVSRMQLASQPFFPEVTTFECSFLSPHSEFSSDEIVDGAQSGGLFEGFFEEQLRSALQGGPSPAIVGLSIFLASQIVPAFRCAAVVRKLCPDAHITIGGATVSCHFRKIDNPRLFGLVDSIVLDEGELPLEALWREITSPDPRLERVPSLVWLDGGTVRRNELAPRRNMEDAPLPDYEAFPVDHYQLSRDEIRLPFRLSMGCPWGKCAFCMTARPIMRNHQQASAEYLFEQIRMLRTQHGFRRFHFVDECPDPIVLEKLCNLLIDGNVDIDFRCHLRFDTRVTLDRCMAYRQAGCSLLVMGLEHFSDRMLTLMRKGTTTAVVDRVLSNFNWSGLRSNVYMIVGFPTETEDEARASYATLKDRLEQGLVTRFGYYNYMLLLDSEVGRHPERFGVHSIRVPAGYDLEPPVRDFACEGMTRARAGELEVEFNRDMRCHRAPGGPLARATRAGVVEVAGSPFHVALDPAELFGHIEEAWVTATCHGERLRRGPETIAPIRPVRRS